MTRQLIGLAALLFLVFTLLAKQEVKIKIEPVTTNIVIYLLNYVFLVVWVIFSIIVKIQMTLNLNLSFYEIPINIVSAVSLLCFVGLNLLLTRIQFQITNKLELRDFIWVSLAIVWIAADFADISLFRQLQPQ